MDDQDFQKAILNYVIHIADNQARMVEAQTKMPEAQARILDSEARIAEAIATLGAQNQAIASILERVTRTTDRTEQMVAGILARLEPDKVSH